MVHPLIYVCNCLLLTGSPVVTYLNSSIVSFEGLKVTMTCVATNNFGRADQLQVKWYDNNGKIVSSNSNNNNNNNNRVSVYYNVNIIANKVQSSIIFESVNRSDHGEYRCKVYDHPNNTDEARTNLTVEC